MLKSHFCVQGLKERDSGVEKKERNMLFQSADHSSWSKPGQATGATGELGRAGAVEEGVKVENSVPVFVFLLQRPRCSCPA